MTLIMKTAKGAAIFEWADEDAETVVKIEPTDDDEVMVRKLKRIIALVEGEQAALPPGVPAYAMGPEQVRKDRQPLPSNGWAAYAPPPVPPHLEGEIELVQPGEEA